MVIGTIYYRQAHIFTGKLLRRLKPAKTGTNNDHLRVFPCGRLIRGWHRRTIIKRLSLRLPELTFPPYAKEHCTQQNAQISGETLQDHRPWKGLAGAFLATPSLVDEKCQAQTPAGQSSAR